MTAALASIPIRATLTVRGAARLHSTAQATRTQLREWRGTAHAFAVEGGVGQHAPFAPRRSKEQTVTCALRRLLAIRIASRTAPRSRTAPLTQRRLQVLPMERAAAPAGTRGVKPTAAPVRLNTTHRWTVPSAPTLPTKEPIRHVFSSAQTLRTAAAMLRLSQVTRRAAASANVRTNGPVHLAGPARRSSVQPLTATTAAHYTSSSPTAIFDAQTHPIARRAQLLYLGTSSPAVTARVKICGRAPLAPYVHRTSTHRQTVEPALLATTRTRRAS